MTQRRTNEIIARKERETGLNERNGQQAKGRREMSKKEIHRFGDQIRGLRDGLSINVHDVFSIHRTSRVDGTLSTLLAIFSADENCAWLFFARSERL